jgi:hypothetical protein
VSAAELRWRDRLTIARHEITTAAIVVADLLDKGGAAETDWNRLVLALHRLQALAEIRS